MVGFHQLRACAIPMVHFSEVVELQFLHVLVPDMQIIDSQCFVYEILVKMLSISETGGAKSNQQRNHKFFHKKLYCADLQLFQQQLVVFP